MAKTKKELASTEAKILEAAHKVFLAKGFSAATVRDVAKEAKANVASVNYYFKSKENLFNQVMAEKVGQLLSVIGPILNDESTTLEEKIQAMADSYIDFLLKNPDLIAFATNEIRKRDFEFISKVPFVKVVYQSCFFKQLAAQNRSINPLQFFISLVGMMAFPFVIRPMMLKVGLVKDKEFLLMMEERKKIIPQWINTMLTGNA